MNIFIKSFNRPYYLERCLTSVYTHVQGFNEIYVLDDGTDPKYLDKIQNIFPEVKIRISPSHPRKVTNITNFIFGGIPIPKSELPLSFWLQEIESNSKNYFLLLEDDMWFTADVNLAEVGVMMKEYKICIHKLFHFNNPKLNNGKKTAIKENVKLVEPSLFTKNERLFKMIFADDIFKIKAIFYKLGIDYIEKEKVKYYTIYNVAGTVFSLDYYRYLWQGVSVIVNEDIQLIRSLEYFNKYKPKYSYENVDVVKTSFSSSATNMFLDIDFNVYDYNYLLNEAWMQDQFDSASGLPDDIEKSVIKDILKNSKIKIEEWEKWRQRFKQQYQDVGHQV